MVTMNTEGVGKRATANFIKQLVIPSILTNTNVTHCKVFQITYELKVICKTPGCTISPKIKFTITLGSVPLAFGGPFQPNMNIQPIPNMAMPPLPIMEKPPLPNMVPTAPAYMRKSIKYIIMILISF